MSPVSDRPLYVRQTAERTLSAGQRAFGAAAAVVLVLGLLLDTLLTLRVIVGLMLGFSTAYFALRMVLVRYGSKHRFPDRLDVATEDLPRYTTLHPLYDEANMIPHVVAAMEALDYPKDRLQCLLVLEERDRDTVEAARRYPLPDYFEIVETPAVRPYGKPKACNYALQFATGEFVVIYDAEDRPEPQQLRKAAGTFRAAEERGDPLGCVQARLVFENQTPLKGALGEVVRDREGYDVRPTTWCSRFLGIEYIVHFELILAGLSLLGLPVPLGGTSNHFPTQVLSDIAFHPAVLPEMPGEDASIGAWDPWNVTEDAELGGAIAAHGYTTAVFDSHTDEEAVLTPLAAINQRSRWVKGFAQTSLVLLRRPVRNARAMGPLAFAVFLLQVGGTYLSLLLAPITWALTGAYVATQSDRITALFPGPMYYLGLGLFVLGNLALVSVSVTSALRREQFGTIRYILVLTPIWWTVLSIATWVATLELVFPCWRPSWNKTAHGVRYVSRRRAWWLAFQAGVRHLESRPSKPAVQRPLTPPLPLRPALAAPEPALGGPRRDRGRVVRVIEHEPIRFLPRPDAGRRAVVADRAATQAPSYQRTAIADRRAAARAATGARRQALRHHPPQRQDLTSFGSGSGGPPRA